jgi:signal transduction histidine kinase
MARHLDPEVQYSLVRNFARQTPINITITSVALVFTTWMVWPYTPAWLILPWIVIHGGLVGLLLTRWLWRRRVRSIAIPKHHTLSLAERAEGAQRRAIAFALVSGLLWGSTTFALPYLPERYDAALTIIVGALAGGATTTLSAIPAAAACYALAAILPFSIYFFAQGTDPASISLGVLAAVMGFAMSWASRSVHGTFLDDVAARVAATKALEDLRSDREDWLQVAQSTDAFALFDSNQKLKFWNQAFADLIREDERPAELAGAAWPNLIDALAHSEDISIGLLTHAERRQRYLSLSQTLDDPLVERLSDGRWMRSVVRPTSNKSFVWLVQDITAERSRENTEIKLRARLAEAKQLQTIGQFAGGVAHDFNNVLGAIQSFAEYIAQLPIADDAQRAARRIVTACERGAGMVHNILQLATASRVEKVAFRFGIAFEQAVNLLNTRKPETAKFEATDSTGATLIEANASQMVQLLMNLVANAFTALKRAPGRVELRAVAMDVDTLTASQFFDAAAGRDSLTEASDGASQYVFGMLLPNVKYVKISVEDTGAGIEPTLLPRIFDPFVSTKESTLRTGFGLAVVRSVVLVSEGALSVRSKLGAGTTFDVYIPVAVAETASATTIQPNSAAAQKVLIVDDDMDVADGMALALKGLGHDTRAIYDPLEALALIKSDPHAWPVLVIDMSMPNMTGDVLAEEVRKLSSLARIFIYTGRATDQLRTTAARLNVEGVLQKPLDPKSFSAIIGRG